MQTAVTQTPSQQVAKKTQREVSPLRKLTTQLDKQVKKVEAKKIQIEKLQKSLLDDQTELQNLLKKIGEIR
jgi:hypothetical protein